MREAIRQMIQQSFMACQKQEGWIGTLPGFEIERPKVKSHGDFSTNLAMLLAKPLRLSPQKIAELLIKHLSDPDKILEKVEVAGAGFINFTCKTSVWQEALLEMGRQDNFGRSKRGQGKKVVIEFISANPTGPLHIGNARGGPMGDVIATLLEWSGYQVVREYYVNDVGGQIDKLGESIWWELHPEQAVTGERHYSGSYIQEIAQAAQKKLSGKLSGSELEQKKILGRFGIDFIFEEIKQDCEKMGIRFDSFVHERTLLISKATETILAKLKQKGVAQEKEGALWFVPEGSPDAAEATSGEDRESVLVRSDGRPTYFAGDIAYHAAKYEQGFDRILNVWGSNHHGHVPRIQAAVQALGYDPKRIETILYQYVRVKRGTDIVKMSKRAGNYVTAREVLDEVGCDAFRFFLLMRAASSHLDFDIDLAKQQSQDNPVYYVQYAHARLASIFRKALEKGIALPQNPQVGRLTLPEELQLISLMGQFPDEVCLAAERLEPHRIPFYLLELAQAFQSYYSKAKEDPNYRVLGSDIDTSEAKLYLCHILKRTFALALKLVGVSAPDVMVSGEEN